ncbi:MAG: hypothetical protein IPK04_14175 [Bdellovibrionales bacterium]|nr:hypothetical protein [Bdellovibrionales bacterium]
MISPSDIVRKCESLWLSQAPLRSEWEGIPYFPVEIPFRKTQAKELLQDFGSIRKSVAALREQSKEAQGFGYEIEYSTREHRQLGIQVLPEAIRIPSIEDLSQMIGKARDLAVFRKLSRELHHTFPALSSWIGRAPLAVVNYSRDWDQLVAIVKFFLNNPRPGLYIRQLQIPGVDSKFVESHKGILREILDEVLPADSINQQFSKSSASGFEQRFGLLYDESLVRVRSLDPEIDFKGFTDVSIPLSQLIEREIPCQLVCIVENKINALAMPPISGAIVIFGAGYGIAKVEKALWLRNKKILYWGDIDTHGFSILSTLRSFLGHAESFLMDRETLLDYKNLWVPEPKDCRCLRPLENLSSREAALYVELQSDIHGKRVRLEQERVPYDRVLSRLLLKDI